MANNFRYYDPNWRALETLPTDPWTNRIWGPLKNRLLSDMQKGYSKLFKDVSGILFELDPVGINYGSNTDEYDLEALTIIPQLNSCRSANDVFKLVVCEFRHWFSVLCGPAVQYKVISRRIWAAWQRHLRTQPRARRRQCQKKSASRFVPRSTRRQNLIRYHYEL
jgi:hypothetical protein